MDSKDKEIETLKRELAKARSQAENVKPYMCMNQKCINRALCS